MQQGEEGLLRALRAASREAARRAELRGDAAAWALIAQGIAKGDADALPCCVNLFVDDVDGDALRLAIATGVLDVVARRVAEGDVISRIAVSNAAKQTQQHREALKLRGVVANLLRGAEIDKVLPCLIAILDESASPDEQITIMEKAGPGNLIVAHFICQCREPCIKGVEYVVACLALERTETTLVDFLATQPVEVVKEAGVLQALLNLLGPHPEDTPANVAAAELLSTLFQPCSPADAECLNSVNGVERLLEIISDTTQRIGNIKDSSVLPRSRIRRGCLTVLCNFSAEEQRCKSLGNVANVCVDIALESCGFDLEATREAIRILKNLTLAVPGSISWSRYAKMSAKVIASVDGEACALVGASMRLGLRNGGDLEMWRSIVDPSLIVAILSIDLVRFHPFGRVELARALAAFMLAASRLGVTLQGDDEVRLASLQSLQALRFVSFLLAAPQVELQLEVLDAVVTMPNALLALTDDPPLEIFLGMTLRNRLETLVENGKTEFGDLKVISASDKAAGLLKRIQAAG